MTDNISEEVRSVLSELEIIGNHVRIVEQVDRKLYVAVNKVLMRIGGKWNRKAKAHVFSEDPTDLIELVIESGMLNPKIKTGYFPTPDKIIDQMLDLAHIPDFCATSTILEPSAGQGHIVDKIKERVDNISKCGIVHICENLPENVHILEEKGYVVEGEFFEFASECVKYDARYDRVIMNPPFERQADIDHVTAAFGLLAPGGVLIAVMSAGALFRENQKATEFRETILNPHGTYVERLPEGAFKTSGTMVSTIIVRLERAQA